MTDTEMLDAIERQLDFNIYRMCRTLSVTISAKDCREGSQVRFSGGPWRRTLREAIQDYCERR